MWRRKTQSSEIRTVAKALHLVVQMIGDDLAARVCVFDEGCCTTDLDGNTTFVGYDSALRPLTMTSATGASTTTTFDKDANNLDLLAYSQKVTYTDAGVTEAITSKSWFDGAGRAIRSGVGTGASPTSFDASAAVYDSLGRPLKQSNPYTGNSLGIGSPAYWTTSTYDLLSRVTAVTLPDGQTVQTAYNGATVTVTDQVGRKRKSQADGLGRLISVTEQDPANGVLSLVTTYSYETRRETGRKLRMKEPYREGVATHSGRES